ncbi:MAG: SurA N-terminal domain-containing protein [Oligoflexales bacterium]|nr:SurA N-terminal domain-containing protein [Oligoflexales bacterium]
MFRTRTTTTSGENKKNLGVYIVLILCLFSLTFFGVCAPRQSGDRSLSGVAASVGGDEISFSEFSRAYNSQAEQLKSRYGADFDPKTMKMASMVMDKLIDSHILTLEADQLGLTASNEEIVRYLNNIKAFRDKDGKFSPDLFRQFLRSNMHSESSFQEDIRRSLSVERLRSFISRTTFAPKSLVELDYKVSETKMEIEFMKVDPDKMKITLQEVDKHAFLEEKDAQEKIKTYYNSHLSDFISQEKVLAQHILVSYKGARNAASSVKRTKEEAKSKAETLLKRVPSEPDFGTLARKETDEPSGKSSGGNLGFFTKDAMVKEFSDAAFALTPGQLSSVVETPFGFHIIKVLEKKPKNEKSLEQASDEIVETLVKQVRAPKFAKEIADVVLEKIKAKTLDTTYLQGQGLRWESTGAFALSTNYIPSLGSQRELLEAALKLKNAGDASDVLSSQNKFYILRLLKKDPADTKALTEDKREETAQSIAYSEGYTVFQDFEKKSRDRFDQKKAVYKNPEYLALDDKSTKDE